MLAGLVRSQARKVYTEADKLRRLAAKLADAVDPDTSEEDTENGRTRDEERQ